VQAPQSDVVGVIVAAGTGSRLGDSLAGGTVTKALRLLGGRPLVTWSAERLIAGGVGHLIVVCPTETEDQFAAALGELPIPVTLTPGGETRQDSVRAGLTCLPAEAAIVLVHDAARPLVPSHVVRAVIEQVRSGADAAVPVVPITDSIRVLVGDQSQVIDRATLRGLQTPQGFKADVLVASHAQLAGESFSDDASVCESCGHRVELVDGSRLAMKITEPIDFAIAEAILVQAEL